MPISQVGLAQQIRHGTNRAASLAVVDGNGNLLIDPATGQPVARIVASGTLSNTDAQDATKSCRITLYASWDHGQTWTAQTPVYVWQGGIGPKGNYTLPSNGWSIPVNAQNQPATNVVAEIDTLGNDLNTGLTHILSSP